MNLLISSVGRQSMLVEAFREALHPHGVVIACDVNEYAAGLAAADRRERSRPLHDAHYVESMMELCRKHQVHLLMTLLVDELRVLESCRDQLASLGVQLIGAPLASIDLAQDKFATATVLCSELGLRAPVSHLVSDERAALDEHWPLIIKPRFGRGSRGITIVQDRAAYDAAINAIPTRERTQFLVQEIIKGQEFGLDVINDLNGRYRGVLARRKLAMRGGETDIAETVDATPFIEMGRLLSEKLKHQGCMDVDVMMDEDQCLYLLDLNMRFGGGYAFSHLAGAQLPRAIVLWGAGDSAPARLFRYSVGVVGARASHIVDLKMACG